MISASRPVSAQVLHLATRTAHARARPCRIIVRAELGTSDSAPKARAEAEPEVVPTPTAAPVAEAKPGPVVAAVAAVAGAGLFLATRAGGGPATLASLEAQSVPLDVALTNGSPTVIEFYANWCKICNEMAPMTYEVESGYRDKVNFVMLNIDNTKWSSEVAEFGVPGIPEFVFLNPIGEPEAIAWGRLPREVLEGDVKALASNEQLPYARVKKGEEAPALNQSLSTAAAISQQQPRQINPLDHS